MPNDLFDKEKNVVAREELKKMRRILKGDAPLSPPPENISESVSSSEAFNGTIKDLIHAIESAVNISPEGNEYWSARALMTILGYGSTAWHVFKEVILQAQYACYRSEQSVDAHFSKLVSSSTAEKVDDVLVTRYGAYLIAQNGDARKKQVAFAQTYFATQTRRQELQGQEELRTKNEKRRLAMREKIAEHNKALADAAREAGIEAPADFARFQNYGYKGLYNGLDMQGIRSTKNLPNQAKILDYMDITELAANFFRATQAEDKLRREKVSGKEEANAAHFEVGRKVRKAIKDIGGTMPEQLPTAENIDRVRRRIAKLDNKT